MLVHWLLFCRVSFCGIRERVFVFDYDTKHQNTRQSDLYPSYKSDSLVFRCSFYYLNTFTHLVTSQYDSKCSTSFLYNIKIYLLLFYYIGIQFWCSYANLETLPRPLRHVTPCYDWRQFIITALGGTHLSHFNLSICMTILNVVVCLLRK
jgi:hypothetical protein